MLTLMEGFTDPVGSGYRGSELDGRTWRLRMEDLCAFECKSLYHRSWESHKNIGKLREGHEGCLRAYAAISGAVAFWQRARRNRRPGSPDIWDFALLLLGLGTVRKHSRPI